MNIVRLVMNYVNKSILKALDTLSPIDFAFFITKLAENIRTHQGFKFLINYALSWII